MDNNVPAAGNNGEIARLTFCRNAKNEKSKPENGSELFTVMINPESISRQMSLSATENKAGKSKSKGDPKSCEPEVISFTFYLDGTNVVPKVVSNEKSTTYYSQSVDAMINDFLNVVYKTPSGEPVKAVAIKFGEQCWTVRTNSISVEHNLFSKNGTTLRAKITCSFSTITDDSSDKKTPSKPKKPAAKPVSCECACPPVCVNDARSSNQDSLFTPADANFTTADGREIKI